MKHLSAITNRFFSFARRGVLLLALGAAGPAAWGQSFGPASLYGTGAGSGPQRMALGDVNGDGRPDIAVTNVASNSVGVLLGQASGGFGAVSTYTSGLQPSGIALGDVNGDGRLDLVVSCSSSHAVWVFMRQASGFAPAVSYTTGTNSLPSDVALGDVDGDGRLDIVTSDKSSSNGAKVLLGQAGGFFGSPTAYPTGTSNTPSSVALGDLNGDGRLDVVLANLISNDVSVLLSQGGGGFTAASTFSVGTGSEPSEAKLGDVNGDGRLDIITGNYLANTVGVLLGQSGGFATVSTYASLGRGSGRLALGDVNGDGRLDIVTGNYSTNDVSVLLGQASGFATARIYPMGSNAQPAGVAVGDVNGDGRLDIVTGNYLSNTVGELLNTGTYTPLATARPTAADLTLAPNPAHDAFTVQLPAGLSPSRAELLNALGQVVRRPAVGAASFTVPTSGLAPGLYTLRLLASGTALARRVVVE